MISLLSIHSPLGRRSFKSSLNMYFMRSRPTRNVAWLLISSSLYSAAPQNRYSKSGIKEIRKKLFQMLVYERVLGVFQGIPINQLDHTRRQIIQKKFRKYSACVKILQKISACKCLTVLQVFTISPSSILMYSWKTWSWTDGVLPNIYEIPLPYLRV